MYYALKYKCPDRFLCFKLNRCLVFFGHLLIIKERRALPNFFFLYISNQYFAVGYEKVQTRSARYQVIQPEYKSLHFRSGNVLASDQRLQLTHHQHFVDIFLYLYYSRWWSLSSTLTSLSAQPIICKEWLRLNSLWSLHTKQEKKPTRVQYPFVTHQ